jgi:predicted negative regulator of RcsB-dependent stress response
MAGSYDFEEQERIAAIHHWWEDNAKFVYAAAAAFVLSIGGWRGWQYWAAYQSEDAAMMAAELPKVQGDAKKAGDIAQAIIDKHPGSFFASDAALVSAQASFEAGDLAAARTRLTWVLEHGREEHRGLARLRLAAVLLDQKKYDEALKTLDGNTDPAWAPLVADLKGDIHFAQGHIDEARAAYKTAIDKSEPSSPLRALTELKLGALGGAK